MKCSIFLIKYMCEAYHIQNYTNPLDLDPKKFKYFPRGNFYAESFALRITDKDHDENVEDPKAEAFLRGGLHK